MPYTGFKLCKDCLSWHRRRVRGARKVNGVWPKHLYHTGKGRCCEKHAAQRNADGSARRARELQQCPAWADRAAIREVFERAQQLTRSTGIKHQVDHVIPLRGRLVSGMHIASNLQVLRASENARKSNRFTPG